jgi:putative DNA primase/helicase
MVAGARRSFARLSIILWPDSDEPGEKYISHAAKCLKDSAASIKVVRPFGPPNGTKGRDVCDWTGNAEDLAALVAAAEIYGGTKGEPQASRPNGGTAPEFSEDALALHLADQHSNEFRYIAAWGKWLVWTATHWEIENTLAVFDMARKICREAGTISAKKESKK